MIEVIMKIGNTEYSTQNFKFSDSDICYVQHRFRELVGSNGYSYMGAYETIAKELNKSVSTIRYYNQIPSGYHAK